MADSSYDIDGIVKQVLAGLRAGNDTAVKARDADATKTNGRPGEVVVNSAVVTLAQIAGRLDGVRHLTVSRGAVLTPSVRDLLRQNNIALTYSAEKNGKRSGNPAATPERIVRLELVAAVLKENNKLDAAALAKALRNDGMDVEQSQSDCLIETTGRLSTRINDQNCLGAIITSHPAAAVCLANRLQGVRAVAPATPDDVLPACKDVGANLIVIDPAGRGFFQIKQMIREFCLSGRHDCPKSLREQLQ